MRKERKEIGKGREGSELREGKKTRKTEGG